MSLWNRPPLAPPAVPRFAPAGRFPFLLASQTFTSGQGYLSNCYCVRGNYLQQGRNVRSVRLSFAIKSRPSGAIQRHPTVEFRA